jgi:hypothetical protein
MRFGLRFLLIPLVLAMVSGGPVDAQGAAMRRVVVLNQGNEAIFALRLGQTTSDGTESWGDDVLGFDRVIDVGDGRELRLAVDAGACIYDMQATYGDGHAIVQRIDLCSPQRVSFRH